VAVVAVIGSEFPRIPLMPWSRFVRKQTPVLFDVHEVLSCELVVTEFIEGMDILMTSERCLFRKRVPIGKSGDDFFNFDAVIGFYERFRGGFEPGYSFLGESVGNGEGGIFLTSIIKTSGDDKYWTSWDEVVNVASAMGVTTPKVIWRGIAKGGMDLRRIMDEAIDDLAIVGTEGVCGVVLRPTERLTENGFRIGKLVVSQPARRLESRLWAYPEE
jgi:hypothetical protein